MNIPAVQESYSTIIKEIEDPDADLKELILYSLPSSIIKHWDLKSNCDCQKHYFECLFDLRTTSETRTAACVLLDAVCQTNVDGIISRILEETTIRGRIFSVLFDPAFRNIYE